MPSRICNSTCVFLEDVVKNRYIKNITQKNNALYGKQATNFSHKCLRGVKQCQRTWHVGVCVHYVLTPTMLGMEIVGRQPATGFLILAQHSAFVNTHMCL